MKDTAFSVPEAKRDRLATCYQDAARSISRTVGVAADSRTSPLVRMIRSGSLGAHTR
jgi:CubicO group peptidase (beta-lactamase class C family)